MSKILVVDDDFSNADAIQMVLEAQNFDVMSIHKCELLQATIQQFKPDLIVMDILLDTNDGRNLCDLIKADQNTCHIRVLLITAMLEWQAKSIASQADALMFKPFDYTYLNRMVTSLLVAPKHFPNGSYSM